MKKSNQILGTLQEYILTKIIFASFFWGFCLLVLNYYLKFENFHFIIFSGCLYLIYLLALPFGYKSTQRKLYVSIYYFASLSICTITSFVLFYYKSLPQEQRWCLIGGITLFILIAINLVQHIYFFKENYQIVANKLKKYGVIDLKNNVFNYSDIQAYRKELREAKKHKFFKIRAINELLIILILAISITAILITKGLLYHKLFFISFIVIITYFLYIFFDMVSSILQLLKAIYQL